MPPKRKRGVYHGSNKRRRMARLNVRRSRVIRRRRGRSNFSKAIDQHVYCRYGTPVELDGYGLETDYAQNFMFNQIKAYSEFSQLYDRYRITCVQLQVSMVNNPDAFLLPNGPLNNQNVNNIYPKFWYVRDYDDNSPLSLDALRERAMVKCILLRPNKIFKINVRPAILAQTYRTLATTGYAPKWKQWIDMAQTDVPHYGIKYAFDFQNQSIDTLKPYKFRIEFKYFFTCKNVL